jgi:hypothetical protein
MCEMSVPWPTAIYRLQGDGLFGQQSCKLMQLDGGALSPLDVIQHLPQALQDSNFVFQVLHLVCHHLGRSFAGSHAHALPQRQPPQQADLFQRETDVLEGPGTLQIEGPVVRILASAGGRPWRLGQDAEFLVVANRPRADSGDRSELSDAHETVLVLERCSLSHTLPRTVMHRCHSHLGINRADPSKAAQSYQP